MALLESMPVISVSPEDLREWGNKWLVNKAFNKKEGMDFGGVFDKQVGASLAAMLGGIDLIVPSARELLPKQKDAVEVGPVRVIGGIRPQNYDVGYRPDGVRFAFDSKTLNDTKSVGKNFQNMVNDLGTEVIYHDPYVPNFDEHGIAMENQPLTDELLESCTMCIIATDHQAVDYDRVVSKVPHTLDTRIATKRLTGNRDKVTLL